MELLITDYGPAIARETHRVYKHGLKQAAETHRLPVLAELAALAIADGGTDVEALESLLHRCIAAVAPQLLSDIHASESDIKKGLAELFGLSDSPDQTLDMRRDRAGPSLGYPNGNEGLRKATRQGSRLTRLIVHVVASQLDATAQFLDFKPGSRSAVPLTNQRWRADVGDSTMAVYSEMLYSMGLTGADEDVRDMAAYLQDPGSGDANVSPIARMIASDFPDLCRSERAMSEIDQLTIHQFLELVHLYDTGFNVDADYIFLNRVSWVVYLLDTPDEWSEYKWPSAPNMLERNLFESPEAWLILLVISRLYDGFDRQLYIASLLGLPLNHRGSPRCLREWEVSWPLGYQHPDELRDSGLALRVIFDLTHALVRLAIELGDVKP